MFQSGSQLKSRFLSVHRITNIKTISKLKAITSEVNGKLNQGIAFIQFYHNYSCTLKIA